MRFRLLKSLLAIAAFAYATQGLADDSSDVKAVQAFSNLQSALNGSQNPSCPQAEALPPQKKDACNEPPQPATADDSPRKEYFKQLLAKGMSAPIEDFLKLWYPDRDKGREDAWFLNCGPSKWQAPDLAKSGCEPDVLYSWGPPEKIKTIQKNIPDGKNWTGNPNDRVGSGSGVYATIDPVSSYSYGLVQVRFKFKKGTAVNPAPLFPFLVELFVTRSEDLESWSYGTPEQYDEIVQDIRRISSGKPALVYMENMDSYTGLNRVYHSGVPERGPQNETQLKTNLLEMIRMILNGEGRINYANGACRNRARTFTDVKPTYFN